jgi:hypothetical protein
VSLLELLPVLVSSSHPSSRVGVSGPYSSSSLSSSLSGGGVGVVGGFVGGDGLAGVVDIICEIVVSKRKKKPEKKKKKTNKGGIGNPLVVARISPALRLCHCPACRCRRRRRWLVVVVVCTVGPIGVK